MQGKTISEIKDVGWVSEAKPTVHEPMAVGAQQAAPQFDFFPSPLTGEG